MKCLSDASRKLVTETYLIPNAPIDIDIVVDALPQYLNAIGPLTEHLAISVRTTLAEEREQWVIVFSREVDLVELRSPLVRR